MEAKVSRWGENRAVRLTREAADRLGISEGQTVEIVPDPEPWKGLRFADGSPIDTLEEMVAEMWRLGPDFAPPIVDRGPDVGSESIDDHDPR